MCGIVGYASTNLEISENWLHRAIKKLYHRGPDDEGCWISQNKLIGFGHRRLSINDLSKSGSQPMSYQSKDVKLILNGEIYNNLELRKYIEINTSFKNWKGTSDTETLMMLIVFFGIDKALEKIKGMFSFAFLDESNSDLYIVRDRVGEKPLFYIYEKGTIRFASELKALLEDKLLIKKIDIKALDCYLAFGYVPSSLCILKNFNKLEPGNLIHYKLNTGEIKKRQYWNVNDFVANGNDFFNNKEDITDHLEKLLEESVYNQLIADVPVGVLLSGGLDSSLITAIASRKINNLKTFNVSFPGYKKEDESSYAKLISNYFNTDHIELEANPDNLTNLEKLIWHFDEPMVDSSMIPTFLITAEVKKYCKVALGGDGSDELFGGYPHYSKHLFLEKTLSHISLKLRKSISDFASENLPLGFKGRNWFASLESDMSEGLPRNAFIFDRNSRNKLLDFDKESKYFADYIFHHRIPQSKNILQRSMIMDFQNYLAEDILVKIDRASMANSLELRSPFLDKSIIEFVYKISPNLKVKLGNKKIILKELAKRILPKEFNFKRKQGFSIPINQWLQKGNFRELFWDTLGKSDISFNRNAIDELMSLQDKGYNNGERLFAILQFELWKKNFSISL